VFVIWEMTDKDPIVNLRLFRHRNFTRGTIAMVVAYAAFFSVGILVPLWLQTQMGYTPIWAGFAVAPIGILPVLLSPFVGKYAHKFDLRIAGQPGVHRDVAEQLRARRVQPMDVDFNHIALVQLLHGFGVALFFMPTLLQILLSDLQPHEIADGLRALRPSCARWAAASPPR
jgi:DHA2 family multidrug resistance protein